jgi:hypothetical protein
MKHESQARKMGMERFISAWNCHHLPSRGIPNLLRSHRNGTTAIHPNEIPSTQHAADNYRRQGGTLSDPQLFGSNPLILFSVVEEMKCFQKE